MHGRLAAVVMSSILPFAVSWHQGSGSDEESATAPMPVTGLSVPGMEPYDRIISELMAKHSVPGGVVAVAKEGRLVLLRGYGYSDVDRKDAVHPEALFRIGSLSKQITAAAVLKLMEEGKLDLDAKAFPIIDYLAPPSGASVDARLQNITVRQLLTHSGGWDRELSFDTMFNPVLAARVVGAPSPGSAETIIRYMLGQPLDFDPGARYAYSNFGYNVLGRIIEKITGMSYAQYVQNHILAPMGIVRMRLGKTHLEDRTEGEVRYYDYPGAPLSTSVFSDVTGEVPLPYGGFYIEAMDAHGGWIASGSDLIRFTLGIEGRRGQALLDADTIGTMLARPPVSTWATSPHWYGMGWWVQPWGTDANWWHIGTMPAGTFAFQVRTYNGLNWAALFNSRPHDCAGFQAELNDGLWEVSRQVTAWPNHDLFLHSYGFAIANKGVTSATTAGLGATVAGYARIEPIQGSTTPSGIAVFGLRQGGVLVSEAAVPASPLIRSGRVYAEVRPPVYTGLAIANPNS
jgi:CubicO group peptidase (beta-lactamase class C family)